jgi:nitrile hydratase alpha subunit
MPNDPANAKQRAQSLGRVVARCWTDDAFKKELLADPARVLAANGITVPAGTAVKILEDSPTVSYLVLPTKPTDLSLSELTADGITWCWCF